MTWILETVPIPRWFLALVIAYVAWAVVTEIAYCLRPLDEEDNP